MLDYSDGKIYQICSLLTNKIYIGSTTLTLNERFRNHKDTYDYYIEGNNIRSSFEMLEYGDCFIELIEDCPCNSKKELERREGELQLQFIDVIVNKVIAGRTQKQYREANKDEISKQRKAYYKEHTEERCMYNKEYRDAHKAEQQEYRDGRKLIKSEYDTEYRDTNQVKIQEYRDTHKLQKAVAMKAYNSANKDRFNQLRRERTQRMKLVNAINPT